MVNFKYIYVTHQLYTFAPATRRLTSKKKKVDEINEPHCAEGHDIRCFFIKAQNIFYQNNPQSEWKMIQIRISFHFIL